MDRNREDWLMRQVEEAAAAHVLPRFRSLAPGDVRSKAAADDLVTAADLACEAALAAALAREWPEALVIGEEAVASDPGLLDRVAGAETCVFLDPVDGTWNFANGLSVFGVIVAVTRFGKPVWGGLYDPVGADWVVAAAGRGCRTASHRTGTTPVACGPGRGATDLGGLTGYVPLYLFEGERRRRLAGLLPSFHRTTNLRCSCHEHRMVALGRADFLLTGQLNAWDHAAGALAVQEASGVARMLDGRPYNAALRNGALLTARDEATWQSLAEAFHFLT